jgi:aminopeptidase N
VDPSITDLFQLLNGNNYQKGGWVLHMLRRVMGDEKFFAGIREYYRAHRDGNAMTSDLQREMEKQYARPLDWFFRQWVMESGYPIYDADWSWDQPGKQVRLTIRQKQQGTVFQMPVDIDIRLASGSRREVIEVNQREQTFTFNVTSRPQAIALDPDEWILKEATVSRR